MHFYLLNLKRPGRLVQFPDWSCCLFLFLVSFTSVAVARDLELLDLVHNDAGICAEINGLENKVNSLENSPLVQRFCKSLIYQEWRSSNDYQKVEKGRKKIESIANRPIREVITSLFGKATIVAFFPEEKNWDALLLTEARDEETLREMVNIWVDSGSYQTEQLEHNGGRYFRRFRTGESGDTVSEVYYIHYHQYFALSDSESRIQDVINLYTIAEEKGIESESFKQMSLGFSEDYLSARKAVAEDCLASIYADADKIRHLIDPHLLRSKELAELYKTWNKLKSGIIGIRVDENSFAANVSLIQKEQNQNSNSEFLARMQGESGFLSKIPESAIIAVSGKIHLKNMETLLKQIIELGNNASDSEVSEKGKKIDNIRQVSRGLLLGLDLFDDVFPSLKPDWGAYLVPKKDADLKTFPLEGLVAFELPDNDIIVKNGARISLRSALDNGFNTGLNLLAAFYNSEESGKPAVVKTEQNNASILRWVDSVYSYHPAFGLNSKDLVLASDPELIRDYVSQTPENSLAGNFTFKSWMDKYTRLENQWFVLNLKSANADFQDRRDFYISHMMKNEDISEEKATKEIDNLTSITESFDFLMFGLHMGQNELQMSFGVACGE